MRPTIFRLMFSTLVTLSMICGPNPAAATSTSPDKGVPIKQLGKANDNKDVPIKKLGKAKDDKGVPIKKLGKAKDNKPIKKLGKAAKNAIANNDVDIYDGPGGRFKIIGMMRKGVTAAVLERHQDGWLRLKLSEPSGTTWVAEDHLTVAP